MVDDEYVELDVFIRGDRDYVQGSQVLSQSFGFLGDKFDEELVLLSAKFEAITKNRVLLSFDNSENFDFTPIGSATFEIDGQKKAVYFYEDRENMADIQVDRESSIVDFKNLADPLDLPEGVATFKSDGSAESLLEGIIAVVKRLHQEIAPNVVDVWFTALNKSRIRDNKKAERFNVKIEVSHLLKRMVGERVQTLSALTLSAPELDQDMTMNIAFSYRYYNED